MLVHLLGRNTVGTLAVAAGPQAARAPPVPSSLLLLGNRMRPPESEGPVRRRGLLFLSEQVTHTTPGGRARDVIIGDIVIKFMWNFDRGPMQGVHYSSF